MRKFMTGIAAVLLFLHIFINGTGQLLSSKISFFFSFSFVIRFYGIFILDMFLHVLYEMLFDYIAISDKVGIKETEYSEEQAVQKAQIAEKYGFVNLEINLIVNNRLLRLFYISTQYLILMWIISL